jgi:hypothetical protein
MNGSTIAGQARDLATFLPIRTRHTREPVGSGWAIGSDIGRSVDFKTCVSQKCFFPDDPESHGYTGRHGLGTAIGDPDRKTRCILTGASKRPSIACKTSSRNAPMIDDPAEAKPTTQQYLDYHQMIDKHKDYRHQFMDDEDYKREQRNIG